VAFSVANAKGSNGNSSLLSYQWYKNGTAIAIGGSSPDYPVTAVAIEQNGDKYKVDILDNGLCPTTSREATLTVNTVTTTNVFTTASPYCDGDDITLTAQVGGTSPFIYKLTKGGVHVDSTTLSTGTYSHNIPSGIFGTHDGTYELNVSSNCGQAAEKTTMVEIGKVALGTIADGAACQGAGQSFAVSTTGSSPDLSYQWYKDGAPLNDGEGVSGATDQTVQLSNLAMSDSGATYSVTVKANGKCEKSSNPARLSVKEKARMVAQPNPPSPMPCEGTPFTLSASATGYNLAYQWKRDGNDVGGNGQDLTVNASTIADAGSYKVVVTGDCGTAESNTVAVSVFPQPSQPIFAVPVNSPLATCAGSEALQLNTIANGSIAWSVTNGASIANTNTASNSVAGMQPGQNYTVTATVNSGSCLPKTATAVFNRAGDIALSVADARVCEGSTLQLKATASGAGAATITGFNWYRGNTPLASTTDSYTATATTVDAGSDYRAEAVSSACPTAPAKSNNANVSVDPLQLDVALAGTTTCQGSDASLKLAVSQNGIGYQAFAGTTSMGSAQGNGNALDIAIKASALPKGDNTITLVASSGLCPDRTVGSATVKVVERPLAQIGDGSKAIELGEPAPFELDASKSTPATGLTYLWSSPDQEADKAIENPSLPSTKATVQKVATDFLLTVYLAAYPACSDTASLRVALNLGVKVPNSFSPNGDGIHDLFEIPNLAYFKNAVVEVFNQWGERVFKSERGYANPWDGKRDGNPVAESTYYYLVEFNQQGYNRQSGYVMLLR
jgi:gliding motility-associated-like protein